MRRARLQNVPKQRIGRRLRLRVPRQGEFIESRAGRLHTYGQGIVCATAQRRVDVVARAIVAQHSNRRRRRQRVRGFVRGACIPPAEPPNRAWALTDARTQPSRPCARVISQGKLFNLLRARARGAHAAGRRRASHIQRGRVPRRGRRRRVVTRWRRTACASTAVSSTAGAPCGRRQTSRVQCLDVSRTARRSVGYG